MKVKYIKVGIITIVLLIALYLIYIIFFKITTYQTGWACCDVPPWLENELSTSDIIDNDGPILEVKEKDAYRILIIQFYDATTQNLITDRETISEILSMFTYTDEPFIYDEERSEVGTCFFYYNGILPANHPAALFSGFHGNGTNLSSDFGKIERFYLKFHAGAISADQFSFSNNMEEILDKF